MQFSERIKSHHGAMGNIEKYFKGHTLIHSYLEKEKPKGSKSVIYIHIPFCSKICNFCSLNRIMMVPPDNYHKLIIDEIIKYSKLPYIKNSTFDAVYFGGGTPTTLPSEALKEIIIALKENFRFTSDAEFSVETSISELTDEKLDMFQEVGINRFSIGLQTFSDKGRELLGRRGNGKFAKERIKKLKERNFAVVSVDIIYSYPNQTLSDLEKDLNTIFELDLDGFSMYSLISMKNSKLQSNFDEKADFKFFSKIVELSVKNGYKFLELTKMVKKDRYKYVMNRNKGEDTLPLGAGAGGSFGVLLVMNLSSIDAYKKSVDGFKTRTGVLMDEMYLKLNKIKGAIQMLEIPYESDLIAQSESAKMFLDELKQNGFVIKQDNKLILTYKGVYWGNNISRKLIELIENPQPDVLASPKARP